MLSALKSLFAKAPTSDERIAAQPPGVVFPWPKSTVLTAFEEVVVGIPSQILSGSEVIGSVVISDPDAEIHIPTKPSESMILLRLKPGMSASLTKACQAVIIADDKRPRRIKVGVPSK